MSGSTSFRCFCESQIRFEMMFAETPFHWADPSTWPWIIYVWIAIVLAGWAKPAWRWFQRQQASGWPTAPGRIESGTVTRSSSFSRGRARGYTAELGYSYSVEGQSYSGHYEREFGSEEEGWEFIRELQGKPVMVSCNPRNSAKSTLSADAVTALLKMRAPAPQRSASQVGVSNVPAWVKPLLWPFIALSAVGLVVSLWVHLGAVAGRKVAPDDFFWMLHVGIFAVWFPAVLVANRRGRNTSRKNLWKAVLRGSPEWMRYMVYGFFGYAFLNFLIFLPHASKGGAGNGTPVMVWRGFSGHWMAFYSAALAILYSAAASTTTPVEPPGQSQA